jgi:hypothetical protein
MFEIAFEVKCRGRTWKKNIVISSCYESLLIGFQFWSPLMQCLKSFEEEEAMLCAMVFLKSWR